MSPMKLSARNAITASITNEAVDDLKLKKGMSASAVIKSSDVIVAVD
jgi:molybdopterin-binding protein